MSKKILITGANGFLGSAITRVAIKKKYDIRVLIREESDTSNLDGLNLEVVKGDLREKHSLVDAVDGCDIFFT